MTRRRLTGILSTLTAFAILGSAFAANEVVGQSSRSKKTKSSQKKSSSRSTKTRAKVSTGNRLPAFFGKVSLKDEQREKIYKIQTTYRPKIEKLEQELSDLRKKMNKDMEGVLTTTQRRELSKLRNAAAAGASKTSTSKSSKKSSSRKSSSPKKSSRKSSRKKKK